MPSAESSLNALLARAEINCTAAESAALPVDAPQIPDINLQAETYDFFDPETTPMKNRFGQNDRAYEYRVQQHVMACSIAKSIDNTESLCVEAPTGVGKSFAYLVPGILHALRASEPAMICTETIALQEQLLNKDIPYLQTLLPERPFRAVLAKGRAHYLCIKRLQLALSEQESLPGNTEISELDRIAAWSKKTQDGSLSDYPHGTVSEALWGCLHSDGATCGQRRCPHYAKCFYWKARRSWEKADLIVANHALFFSDMKQRIECGESLLPRPGLIIIDEAHAIENVAADHLGVHVGDWSIRSVLNRLYDPRNARGILAVIPGDETAELRRQIGDVLARSGVFFETIQTLIVNQKNGDRDERQLRLKEPIGALDVLSDHLRKLSVAVQEFAVAHAESLSSGVNEEIAAQAQRISCLADDLSGIMKQIWPQNVYWTDYTQNERFRAVDLYAAPLDIKALFREHLFSENEPPVILTSATLTVQNRFDYFLNRTGFLGRCQQLDSPFDFPAQLTLHIPHDLPSPQDDDYLKHLPMAIAHYLKKTNGSAFVLFTSYAHMKRCYDALQDFFETEEIPCWMQGEELTRSQMVQCFKETRKSVIFGTNSFWTGIDIPGESLRNVIITKLPFPVPSDPLNAARGEIIEQKGGRAFMDYSIPEAVIRLRQGAGRLIRTRTDTGILVILDTRLHTKRYGSIFLRSLPECPQIKEAVLCPPIHR